MIADLAYLFWLYLQSFVPGQKNVNRLTLKRAFSTTVFFAWFFPLQCFNGLALSLDRLLFRFEEIEPRGPIFIIGVPRSGTTFLQRLLAADDGQFTCMTLGELLFAPAIIQKRMLQFLAGLDARLGSPLQRLLEAAQRRAFSSLETIHRAALAEPEEDYLALLPRAACFLLVQPFPFGQRIWQLTRFDQAVSPARRRSVMKFYRGIVQRHLYVAGRNKTLLSKNPSFTPMVESLKQTFPDARFIGCARCPHQAVPSLLSSMEIGAARFGNAGNNDFQLQLVEMMQHFYRLLRIDYPARYDDGYLVQHYDRLVREPSDCVERIYERFLLSKTSVADEKISKLIAQSKNYKSHHSYTLEEFGISLEQLESRFGFAMNQSDSR